MSDYISSEIRSAVWSRAKGCCEYCLIYEEDSYYIHEIDHLLPKKHGGTTELDNLALSCFFCNRHKGTDIGSIDPITEKFILFFNPRNHVWDYHFRLEGNRIITLTPFGRVTSLILKFNHPQRRIEREFLIKLGCYPPKDKSF